MRFGSVLVVAALAGGCSEERALKRPNAVCVDEIGRMHVSDYLHHRIVTFRPDGAFEHSFGGMGLGPGGLWRVWELACDGPDRVIVGHRRPARADGDGQVWEVKTVQSGRQIAVQAVDAAVDWVDGTSPGVGGGWWLADSGNHTIVRVDDAFAVAETWGDRGLSAPVDVAVVDGEVWVLDQYDARIRVFDLTGRELRAFGGPDELSFPSAMAVCAGQWVAVADFGNQRVQRYDLNGRLLGGFRPERVSPERPVQLMDVTTDAECQRLYLADSKGDRVLVTTPEGAGLMEVSTW